MSKDVLDIKSELEITSKSFTPGGYPYLCRRYIEQSIELDTCIPTTAVIPLPIGLDLLYRLWVHDGWMVHSILTHPHNVQEALDHGDHPPVFWWEEDDEERKRFGVRGTYRNFWVLEWVTVSANSLYVILLSEDDPQNHEFRRYDLYT